ncbi:hypothetical protein CGRA01v4_01169 [Colletotrichum graminicola]|nr:hypothetical protein CGRA01v4_01169 [Colletotrichum graminicola]
MWLKLRRKLRPSATSQPTSFVFAQPAWGKLHQASAPSIACRTEDKCAHLTPNSLPPKCVSPSTAEKKWRSGGEKTKLKANIPINAGKFVSRIVFAATHHMFRPNFRLDAKTPSRMLRGGGRWYLETWKRGCAGYQDLRPARLMFRAMQSASPDAVLGQDLHSCAPLAGAATPPPPPASFQSSLPF